MNYTNAITRTPSSSMSKGITTQHQPIDLTLALDQHRHYVKALESIGIEVTNLPLVEAYPDSHFVEDSALVYKKKLILLHPGAEARRNEPQILRQEVSTMLPIIQGEIDSYALIDGGDVINAGTTILIGISERTNLAGAQFLKTSLETIDPHVQVEFIQFSGVLHLKSGLTYFGDNCFLGNPDIKLENFPDSMEIHWLPAQEGYAANCLVANGHALHFAECLVAGTLIQRLGFNPVPLELSEFRKMDGSFTCLSLLW